MKDNQEKLDYHANGLKSKNRHCDNFNQETRQLIFDDYWNNISWEQRKTFLSARVHSVDSKRRKVKDVTITRISTLPKKCFYKHST